MTDRAGRQVIYDYDNMKHMTRVTDPQGSLYLHYDKADNLVRLVDANGHQTQWEYDTAGMCTRKIYDDNSDEAYVWNMVANALDTVRDSNGRVTRYTYDANGNLTGITYNTTQPILPFPYTPYPTSHDINATYDDSSRLATVTDAVGTTTYGRDTLGRVTSVDGPFDNDTVNYHYDSQGRRDWMQIAGTNQTSYHYDDLSRLDSLYSVHAHGSGRNLHTFAA